MSIPGTCCRTAPHDFGCGCWRCIAYHQDELIGEPLPPEWARSAVEFRAERNRQEPLSLQLGVVPPGMTSFEAFCASADAERAKAKKAAPKPPRDAPQATLEALIYSVRENGLGALDTPRNRERWKELSPRQRDEIRARLKRIAHGIPR